MEYEEGDTATNPQTGQTVVYRGGQWVPQGGQPRAPQAPQQGIQVRPPVAERPHEPPSGYSWGPNGTLVAITGGPADPAVKTDSKTPPITPESQEAARREAVTKLALSRSLRGRSRDDWYTGGGWQLLQGIPGTTPYDFSAQVATLADAGGLQRVMEMSRENGGKNPLTPLSNTDFQALSRSLTNLDPAQSDQQFQNALQPIDSLYEAMYRNAGGTDLEADMAAIDPAAGARLGAQQGADFASRLPGNEQVDRSAQFGYEKGVHAAGEAPPSISTAAQISFTTPEDREYGARLRKAFRGVPSLELLRSLVPPGYAPPSDESLQRLIDKRKRGESIIISDPQSGVENRSPLQQGLSKFIADPIGGPVAGYVTGVANGVTMGGLDEATGLINSATKGTTYAAETQRADEAKQLMRERSPGAFMGGELAGGFLSGSGIVGGASRAGLNVGARTLSPTALGLDAGMGAAYGGLENNDNRGQGALMGAVTASTLGAGTRGVANRLTPTVTPEVRTLIDEGVRVPPADILGQGGSVGQLVKRVNDGLAATPFGGSMRRNARIATDDVNRAQANRALRNLGETLPHDVPTGTESIRYVQQRLGNVYDTNIPMINGQLTPGLERRFRVTAARANIPDDVPAAVLLRGARDEAMRPFDANGGYTGRSWRDSHETLGQLARAWRNSDDVYTRRAGIAASRLRDQLRALVARDNPAPLAQIMRADRGYASLARLEDAAKSAAAQARGGIVTPGELNSANARADPSKRRKSVGDAMDQDLSSAAQRVLGPAGSQGGSTNINSIIAGTGLATGLATGNPLAYAAAAPFAANEIVNTGPIQSLIRMGLTREAGPTRAAIAQSLRRGGGGATATLTPRRKKDR